jgi:3-hydroxyacyl-CoA dehydrogenase
MTQSSPVSVDIEGNIAWITIDYPPVNATATAVRMGLEHALLQLGNAKVAFLQCAGRTFVAGGDMSEFDSPPELPHLPDVVQAIEDSPIPIVALMHGTVLGGGFEIAMGCAWRIAKTGTKFGLPEVNVGLVPGAGGSQRLPRLIGMENAVDVACSGKILAAEELLKLGGLDLVVQDDLKAAALAFAADIPERPLAVSMRKVPEYDGTLIESKRRAIAARAKGQQSPIHNLDALQWAALPFSEGQPLERALHMKLRHTPESRALRYAFFAERVVGKPAAIAGTTPRAINKVTVVGGGLMGAGIATAMLNANLSVTIIERNAEAAEAAYDRVKGLLEGALKRGKITADTMNARLAAFQTTDKYAAAEATDLAIEAVFEDVAVKSEVFTKLAGVVSDTAILATNTSYLDPRDIFDGIPNPERCLGLHFFSPAHIMKLLEIVRTPDTSPDVLASCFALGKRMRKVSVLSGICDGFIGNRMLSAYRREADYLLADGALPFEVDAAMRAYGMPMGPYELQDLTGLQIAWANRKRQVRDESQRYIGIADQLCELGRLGQRAGMGWYAYKEGNRTPIRDESLEKLIVEYSAANGITRQRFTAEQISERLLAVLASEGASIVAEGIAERNADVDTVQINGYGFPRWRGGPMHYAETLG